MNAFTEQLFVAVSGLACWFLAGVVCAARPRPRRRTALAWFALLVGSELLLWWVATLPGGSHGWMWTAAAWTLRAVACVGLLRTGQQKFSRLARYALPVAFCWVLAGGAWALGTFAEPPAALLVFGAAGLPPGGQQGDRELPSLSASEGEREHELPEDAATAEGDDSSTSVLVVSRELKRGGLAILPIAVFVLIIFGLSRLPQFR